MTKPDGHSIADLIYSLPKFVMIEYVDKIRKYLDITKNQEVEKKLVDKYQWDLKRKTGSRGYSRNLSDDEWIDSLPLTKDARENLKKEN
jgi:hypothetical protein